MKINQTAIQPLKKKKLSDQVCDELERLIINNTLKTGDYFPSERELMEIFAVGRPSIREALHKLAQKGLAEISSGEKARVTRPSFATILDKTSGIAIALMAQENQRAQFERLRELFEIAAVREAARLITDDGIHNLTLILNETMQNIEDDRLFLLNDVRFHTAIMECLNTEAITHIYEVFIDWLIKSRDEPSTLERRKQNHQYHCNILEALKLHDPDGAENAMREHLQYVMASARPQQ